METFAISGNIIDLFNKRIFPGTVNVRGGKIASITSNAHIDKNQYILPGFIDAHVHIESSMLVPSEFARLAVIHGTVATVSDPHEIGNVLGLEGIRYMIANGRKVPFHFYFGASSCVPATTFETAGASITSEEIRELFAIDGLHYLSEMMNFPGVLSHDPMVMDKLNIAKEHKKPIDGHAPGLRGEKIRQYIAAGISTDHECFLLDEALEKVSLGMHILIREGSAAKNFEALHSLIDSHPDKVMFCSDDKHPHDLVKGHINELVRRAVVDKKHDVMNVLRSACLHPITHYKLDVGLLKPGDSADFIVVENLHDFKIKQTYIKGQLVAENGKTLIDSIDSPVINYFEVYQTKPEDFQLKAVGSMIRVIEALDGELITNAIVEPAKIENGLLVTDLSKDILKIAIINRYQKAAPSIGFIRNFGLKKGALASSVAHDSHNIIVVGVEDDDISRAVNALMQSKGGISVAVNNTASVLPLPVAGLMSFENGYRIAERYEEIDKVAKTLGTKLQAPFMTLSFMALLVIPSLKLSDKGLFDAQAFCFVPLNN